MNSCKLLWTKASPKNVIVNAALPHLCVCVCVCVRFPGIKEVLCGDLHRLHPLDRRVLLPDGVVGAPGRPLYL